MWTSLKFRVESFKVFKVMKFTDSIYELKIHTWGNYCKKRKAIGSCDDLVENHLVSIDFIRSAIEDAEKLKFGRMNNLTNPRLITVTR